MGVKCLQGWEKLLGSCSWAAGACWGCFYCTSSLVLISLTPSTSK